MDKSLIPAVIAAVISVLGALWSFTTAGRVRRNILRAEERAKRSELVRVKALEAVDELLSEVTMLIMNVETMKFLIQTGTTVSIESTPDLFGNFGKARKQVLMLRYRFAPYVSEVVLSTIDEIGQISEMLNFNEAFLEHFTEKLKSLESKIATDARATYLTET